MIRCIIVDDEPLARERLGMLLREAGGDLEIVAEARDGAEAIALASELRPDLLFLDVQMPGLDGFDVVDLLPSPRPMVVFVTAYDHHALRAFEVHALDYLTKPVRLARLKGTLERLAGPGERSRSESAFAALTASRSEGRLARLTVHAGRRLRVLSLERVRRIEARERMVIVHHDGEAHHTDFTLDELERRLDPARFIRIHRAHIVNVAAVRELIPWFAGSTMLVLDDGTKLPVARRRVREVRGMLEGNAKS
jgi:two-component system LytT family response regulator